MGKNVISTEAEAEIETAEARMCDGGTLTPLPMAFINVDV
jgi:hypothetical protein